MWSNKTYEYCVGASELFHRKLFDRKYYDDYDFTLLLHSTK